MKETETLYLQIGLSYGRFAAVFPAVFAAVSRLSGGCLKAVYWLFSGRLVAVLAAVFAAVSWLSQCCKEV